LSVAAVNDGKRPAAKLLANTNQKIAEKLAAVS